MPWAVMNRPSRMQICCLACSVRRDFWAAKCGSIARAAEHAIYRKVAAPLGINLMDAANGILRIAVTQMAYAVKSVTTARGLDIGNFVLAAYGGAGPLHASALARETGIRRVLIPRAPGHFSACGMLFCDLRHDFVQTRFTRLDELDFAEFERDFGRMEEDGRRAVAQSGVSAASVVITRALDMRYVGQEHLVTIEVPGGHFARQDRAAIKRLFDGVHLQRYGTSAPEERAEIASLRSSVTGLLAKPPFEHALAGGREPPRLAKPGNAPRVVRRQLRRYAGIRSRAAGFWQSDRGPRTYRGTRLNHSAASR